MAKKKDVVSVKKLNIQTNSGEVEKDVTPGKKVKLEDHISHAEIDALLDKKREEAKKSKSS